MTDPIRLSEEAGQFRAEMRADDSAGKVTTTPGGWPDAARPGVPMNPERTGPHWLKTDEGDLFVGHWDAQDQMWFACDESDHYLGPCHTPAEVAALVEAARREAVEACAKRALDFNYVDESGAVSAASQNQALYTYHALMLLSDPGRPLARSIEDAAAIRARGDA